MNTYEIFTTQDSQIVQAKNMGSAIGKYGLTEGNLDKEVIAIIEHERGREFLQEKQCIITRHYNGKANVDPIT